jgi:hypothetical protein
MSNSNRTSSPKQDIPQPWQRVQRCPVCSNRGCLSSGGFTPAAVVCRRVESEIPIGTHGYLHLLHESPPWARWRTSLLKIARVEAGE